MRAKRAEKKSVILLFEVYRWVKKSSCPMGKLVKKTLCPMHIGLIKSLCPLPICTGPMF